MSKTSTKKKFMKLLKGIGITFLALNALIAILILCTYVYNSATLKKEAALIEHKGQYVKVDGHNMNL